MFLHVIIYCYCYTFVVLYFFYVFALSIWDLRGPHVAGARHRWQRRPHVPPDQEAYADRGEEEEQHAKRDGYLLLHPSAAK